MTNPISQADRGWLDEDTWLSIPLYMRGHINRKAQDHANQARLEERESIASYIEGTMHLAHDGYDLTGFEPHNAKCRIFAAAIRNGGTA